MYIDLSNYSLIADAKLWDENQRLKDQIAFLSGELLFYLQRDKEISQSDSIESQNTASSQQILPTVTSAEYRKFLSCMRIYNSTGKKSIPSKETPETPETL